MSRSLLLQRDLDWCRRRRFAWLMISQSVASTVPTASQRSCVCKRLTSLRLFWHCFWIILHILHFRKLLVALTTWSRPINNLVLTNSITNIVALVSEVRMGRYHSFLSELCPLGPLEVWRVFFALLLVFLSLLWQVWTLYSQTSLTTSLFFVLNMRRRTWTFIWLAFSKYWAWVMLQRVTRRHLLVQSLVRLACFSTYHLSELAASLWGTLQNVVRNFFTPLIRFCIQKGARPKTWKDFMVGWYGSDHLCLAGRWIYPYGPSTNLLPWRVGMLQSQVTSKMLWNISVIVLSPLDLLALPRR